jgi:hypothetical protein
LRTFIVTIDTEANAWDQIEKNSIENIDHVPRLQEIFDRHGVKPTYLVTYEMATRDEAVKVLGPIHESGRCEIGHHLHVWTAPPLEQPNPDGVDVAWLRAFQSELPDELFLAKAESLRVAIKDAYGRFPTSHRAGRWGLDLRTLQWLRDTGFVVDSSMTPGISYADFPGARGPLGIDTSLSDGRPFIQDLAPPFRPGARAKTGMLEVPMTAKYPPQQGVGRLVAAALPEGRPWSKVGRKIANRVLPTPLRSIPCRPMPAFREADLLWLAESALRETGIVNLMFHSSEIMVGGSPYTRTEEEHRRLMSHIALLCAWAEEQSLERLTLSELALRILGGTDRTAR